MDFKNGGASASFLFKGDLNEMLAKLASLPVADLLIEEPTLEEIFLSFYGGNGQTQKERAS